MPVITGQDRLSNHDWTVGYIEQTRNYWYRMHHPSIQESICKLLFGGSMAQLIFEDLDTREQHIYPNGIMPKNLPRPGDEVTIYDEENDCREVINGIVVGVSWAYGMIMKNEDDYSVFIYVRKNAISSPEG